MSLRSIRDHAHRIESGVKAWRLTALELAAAERADVLNAARSFVRMRKEARVSRVLRHALCHPEDMRSNWCQKHAPKPWTRCRWKSETRMRRVKRVARRELARDLAPNFTTTAFAFVPHSSGTEPVYFSVNYTLTYNVFGGGIGGEEGPSSCSAQEESWRR